MPDQVLVTCATGFVGSHVAQALVEAGYEVRCGVRASSSARWISNLPVERVEINITGREEYFSRAVENVDLVVHAAGITRARRAGEYHAVNAARTHKPPPARPRAR